MRYIALVLAFAITFSCSTTPESANDAREGAPPSQPKPDGPLAEKMSVSVFYANPELEKLMMVERDIFDTGKQTDRVKQAIDLLTIPPDDPQQGIALWPQSTFAREVYLLDDGTIVVDLDSSFISDAPSGVQREAAMVLSLVQTIVTNFGAFNQVQILLDGHVQETLLGHIDIETPLAPKTDGLIRTDKPDDDEIEVENLLE